MVAPFYPTRTTLTGRARARPGWFGRQVLQVEVQHQRFTFVPARPDHPEPENYNPERQVGRAWSEWRDATWEDVQFLGELTSAFRVAAGLTRSQQP